MGALSNFELSVRIFAALAVVLATCHGAAIIGRLIGQPRVVMEMISGVVLGPSLLGWALPNVHAYLFPAQIVSVVGVLAQIGLALYMLCVGLDFSTDVFMKHRRQALSVSLAGVFTPFILAIFAVNWVRGRAGLFEPHVGTWHAGIFLAAALSITAFPMLARIIRENGLAGTQMGTVAISAGALDDLMAWCFLAIVVASLKSDWGIAGITLGASVAFVFLMLGLVRPALRPMEPRLREGEPLPAGWLSGVLVGLALTCFVTDTIGIYSIFGAFALGVCLPRRRVAPRLLAIIEPLTTALLLPMFFVYSGLNTSISVLASGSALGVTLVLLLAACAGKLIGCSAAARLAGSTLRESLCIGALMNARGLMELILLNIALERKVITPTLYSILVVVAIVTTLIASPLFRLFRSGARTISQVGK